MSAAAAAGLLAALIITLPAAGCRAPPRNCAPPDWDAGPAGPDDTPEAFADRTRRLRAGAAAEPVPPGHRTYQVLALSGGGKYGAFIAGVLNGWSDAGTRPQFDVVTGVSTGALAATYAFLGPKYDARLRDLFVDLSNDDVFRRRRIAAILLSNSVASSDPLARRIEAEITDEVLCEVAAAHAAGRRLYVGTTNLDTKRLVVWDMGAIASSDRPDRRRMFRDVLLASSAIPGQLPPVTFHVRLGDKEYTEVHADGGVTSQLFLRLSLLDVPAEQLRSGPRPLAGSTVHAIVAGKLYADPTCTDPGLLGILRNSVTSLAYALTQNDLVRIHTLALLTGMDFRFTALREDFVDDGNAMGFDPPGQRAFFDEGYRVGVSGDGWRADPPGYREGERVFPRAGAEVTPGGTEPIWRRRR